MPLPTPREGETEKEFIQRCMGDDVMVGEFDDPSQRRKVCQEQWDRNRSEGEEYEERTANEHECRLRDPGDFQAKSFKRVTRESDGKEYSIIMGRLKGKTTMTEQAYRYKDSVWSTSEARGHCKEHEGSFTQSDSSRSIVSFRGAIRVHHTATSEKPWDGQANEARLDTDATEFYYRKAYGWQDPDKNEKTKAAYKFIHHEVSGDGTIGAANIKGCQAGIAVLNGARGGTNIPSSDKQGVWNHLAAHLKDADVEPAPLKRAERAEDLRETRVFSLDELEVRVVRNEGQPVKIVGYAAVFDKLSEDLGGFQEKIAKGAFGMALKTSDARALFNHDPNFVLGRESSKTLTLREDDKGLWMEVIPPDTQLIRDMVLTPIERGDIREQSFGFNVAIDGDRWEGERSKSQHPIRTILKISRIWDVSPVTFAAYNDTKVALRSMERSKNLGISASPDGGGGSHGAAEPKQSAPLSERVEFEREYLKNSRERSRQQAE